MKNNEKTKKWFKENGKTLLWYAGGFTLGAVVAYKLGQFEGALYAAETDIADWRTAITNVFGEEAYYMVRDEVMQIVLGK